MSALRLSYFWYGFAGGYFSRPAALRFGLS